MLWALRALEAAGEISEIIPVVKANDMAYCAELAEEYNISKVRRIVPGGRERQDSVFHGLQSVDDPESIVVVHDGVRPLIEPEVIARGIAQLEDNDGVVIGVPVKDTVKEAAEGMVKQTLDRTLLWAAQTPQIFPYRVLLDAFEKAMQERFYATDDSALVERYGGKIKMVPGSYTNIKVTTPEDLLIAALFLEARNSGA